MNSGNDSLILVGWDETDSPSIKSFRVLKFSYCLWGPKLKLFDEFLYDWPSQTQPHHIIEEEKTGKKQMEAEVHKSVQS